MSKEKEKESKKEELKKELIKFQESVAVQIKKMKEEEEKIKQQLEE